jgi:hypothetical protein
MKSMREHGVVEHFRSIGGSTTRAYYIPIKGHTMSVQGFETGWGVCWHRGRPRVQRTNKTLTTGPFGNTCEADEVSPEVEAEGVVGLMCLQPS